MHFRQLAGAQSRSTALRAAGRVDPDGARIGGNRSDAAAEPGYPLVAGPWVFHFRVP